MKADDSLTSRRRRTGLVVVLAVFVLSRAAFYLAGVRFDASFLPWLWHYLDPVLLQNDLARSLLYLHSQPPLYNLFLGIVLKIAGSQATLGFAVVYLALGLVIAVCLYRLLGELGVAPGLAAALTCLFVVSPPTVLYENILEYTYPVTAGLVAAALCLAVYARTGRFRSLLGFFALLAAVVLTRSLFHPIWLLAAAGLLMFVRPKDRRRIALAAGLACIPVFAVVAKNAVLFHVPGTSSWMGMSVAKMTIHHLPPDERERMAAEGKISPVSALFPFSELARYRQYLAPEPPVGHPAVDADTKSNGNTNYNNLSYIRISQISMHDSLTVLRTRPTAYARALVRAACYYFHPAESYVFFRENRARIGLWDRLFDLVVWGKWIPTGNVVVGRIGVLLLLACPLLFVFGLRRGLKALRSPQEQAFAVAVLFLCFTIGYVSLVGNLLEVEENYRFRYYCDPFFTALLGLALARWGTREPSSPVAERESVPPVAENPIEAGMPAAV